MDVLVVADRLEDAGRERAVQFERELVGVDVGQDIGQVASIERDRRAVTLDRGLDLADEVADLGIGADGDPGLAVGRDLELDDVRRLVGDQGRRPDGAQELLAIEDGPRGVALRHDLLVVRELAVDEPADQVDPVEVEEDLVPAAGEHDLDRVVDIGQDPGQLVERPGRDDHARLGDGVEDRDGLDRDPVVVGGGERQLVALEPGQDAGQDRPCLVAGGRERRLGQGLAHDVLGDPRGRPLAGRADGREFVRVDPLDVGLEPAAAQVERVARPESEIDPVAGRQRVDQVGQQLCRDRRRAIDLDLARDPVDDPDLEVGGGQLEPGVLRLEQDVGQDGERAPVRDGATDDRQAARQVLLHDREFHVGLTPVRGSSRGSADRVGGRAGCRGFDSRRGRAGSVVVGIFSLSSHPVITVVMVWTRWTDVLRSRLNGRWTTGRAQWTRWRSPVVRRRTESGRSRCAARNLSRDRPALHREEAGGPRPTWQMSTCEHGFPPIPCRYPP